MKVILTVSVLCILWMLADRAFAWEKHEHRLLADSAFAAALIECGVANQESLVFMSNGIFSVSVERELWKGKTFVEICALFSEGDISVCRFQERGRSIVQQLRPLSASVIESILSERLGTGSTERRAETDAWPGVFPAKQSDQNVIVNYLLHHLIALRLASSAGQQGRDGRESLRRALIYEAIAQSYLADAFSAGHLLIPVNDFFARFHSVNNKRAHDFYCTEGVFVINSSGDAWQTFGDKLLHWYAPTYRHAREASVSSLRELFLVYYSSIDRAAIPELLKDWGESVSAGKSIRETVKDWITIQDAEQYYSLVKMPTLLLLPTPVSATWSVRTEVLDVHGTHRRKHLPQLKEAEYHDPELEDIDIEFLPARDAVPSWMVLDLSSEKSPRALIKAHPDLASVRYVQERDFPASYAGLLVHIGGGVLTGTDGSGALVGLGYGLVDELLVIRKVSVDAVFMPSLGHARRFLFAPSVGLALKLPSALGMVESSRFEGGYAWGLRSPFRGHGFKFATGVETKTIPLGFTYAGMTVQLKYQWIWLDRTLHGVFLELILH